MQSLEGGVGMSRGVSRARVAGQREQHSPRPWGGSVAERVGRAWQETRPRDGGSKEGEQTTRVLSAAVKTLAFTLSKMGSVFS